MAVTFHVVVTTSITWQSLHCHITSLFQYSFTPQSLRTTNPLAGAVLNCHSPRLATVSHTPTSVASARVGNTFC